MHDKPTIALFNSHLLAKIAPTNNTPPQRESARLYLRNTGGRRLGPEVRYLLTAHHVPGHWCAAGIAWQPRVRVYSDSLGAFTHERAALGALAAFAERELARDRAAGLDGAARNPCEFVVRRRGRLQPPGVDCGVAVLLEIECCANDPESFFTEAACKASCERPEYGALEMEKARARYAIAALDPGSGDANARRNALLGDIIDLA